MQCAQLTPLSLLIWQVQLGRVKRIWYLSPMRAAKVQASLRIRAVSPEPPLLAHTSSESRGTFKQKARSLAPLNGWTCAVKICHDGMLEDTNSLDTAQLSLWGVWFIYFLYPQLQRSRVGGCILVWAWLCVCPSVSYALHTVKNG